MPLPPSNTPWPPKQLATIRATLNEWDAWYVGTPERLRETYADRQAGKVVDRAAQRRGGVVGALARFWWGRPVNPSGEDERVDQLHIPIASDICQASADLLYSEAPAIEVAGGNAEKVQAQIDGYFEDGLVSALAEGAELGAALGGRFHRVTWDQGRVFLSTVDADAAWPVFKWGRLVGVTFWHVLSRDNDLIVRHLECHELDDAGNGVVRHGLYQGTGTSLGQQIPLAEHPATLGLQVDAEGAVVGPRTPGLMVEYVPNQTPNRRWRKDPLGRNLGRSDLNGVEPLMDALDEAYSSWMRDVRNGKGRILAAESMLEDNGPGKGATFDLDRGVYVGLPGLLPGRQDGATGLPIEVVQFAIRVEEHARTCQQLVEDILRSSGYSAQTFGEGPDSAAMTATEVQSRERRSYMTRSRKLRHEAPALRRLITKMLTTDAALRNAALPTDLTVNVAFGDAVADSPLALAQTAQALRGARAASTKTLVEMQHPDWSTDQVDGEVALILGEDAAADPFDATPEA